MLPSADQNEILRRRTFAIISHPDAGKTTLTEKLLLYGGAIHVAGAVKSNEMLWQKWNAEMKKLYPSAIKNLPAKVKDWTGKEHKQGYFENKDQFSTRPVMDSCLVALQLMVYYRYPPYSGM